MSGKRRIAVVSLVVAFALFLIVSTSLAQPPGPPYRYTTHVAKCSEFPPEEVWMTGEVLHIRGLVTAGRTFGDPYFAGTFENKMDIDLNTVSGSGNVHGTTVITPDAYAGTWQGGHFTGPILNFMYSGQGIDYGAGELAGLMDVVQLQEIDPSELPPEFEDPCNGAPVLSAMFAEGMIVEK